MRRKNYKNLISILSLMLLFIAGFIFFQSDQGFTVTGFDVATAPVVNNAVVLSAECVERVESMQLVNIGDVDKAGEFFPCTTRTSKTYIPDEESCDYGVVSDAVLYSVYDCPASVTSEDNLASCDSLTRNFDDNKDFSIREGRSLFIEPKGVLFSGLGTVQLNVRYPSYGLRVEDETGFVKATTESCVLESLPNGYQTLNLGEQTQVDPDIPFNVVTGLSPVKSTRVVDLNGELVYVLNTNQYYGIVETDGGDLIVDTVSGVKYSAEIECIPSVKCSRDAKNIDTLEGQDADLLGGAVSGYAPVTGEPNLLCRYEIVDNKLSKTNDCIEKVVCDDPEKPSFDPYTGECKGLEDETPEDEIERQQLIIFWLVLIGAAIFIVLLAVIYRVYVAKPKPKGKKRGNRK